jgi:hypothetical protein
MSNDDPLRVVYLVGMNLFIETDTPYFVRKTWIGNGCEEHNDVHYYFETYEKAKAAKEQLDVMEQKRTFS